MYCVTGEMLLTLWIIKDMMLFVCPASYTKNISGGVLRDFKCWLQRFCLYLPKDNNDETMITRCLCLLFHWPGSKHSHTRHHGRCLGGSGLGLHHSGPGPLCSRLAGGPGKMTGGSETPLSRSEGLIHLQTACDWPQQLISWPEWMRLPLE